MKFLITIRSRTIAHMISNTTITVELNIEPVEKKLRNIRQIGKNKSGKNVIPRTMSGSRDVVA